MIKGKNNNNKKKTAQTVGVIFLFLLAKGLQSFSATGFLHPVKFFFCLFDVFLRLRPSVVHAGPNADVRLHFFLFFLHVSQARVKCGPTGMGGSVREQEAVSLCVSPMSRVCI